MQTDFKLHVLFRHAGHAIAKDQSSPAQTAVHAEKTVLATKQEHEARLAAANAPVDPDMDLDSKERAAFTKAQQQQVMTLLMTQGVTSGEWPGDVSAINHPLPGHKCIIPQFMYEGFSGHRNGC